MKEVILCGDGGYAKVALGLLQLLELDVPYILSDLEFSPGKSLHGMPVRGPLSLLPDNQETWAFLAIEDNQRRAKAAASLKNVNWATLIHPTAWVDPSARLGAGSCVMAGAVVNADAVLGSHVILKTSASVGHDCVVEDFAILGPGVRLGGGARIGRGALCEIGSGVLPGRALGAWATIGARAAAARSVAAGESAFGIPARVAANRP